MERRVRASRICHVFLRFAIDLACEVHRSGECQFPRWETVEGVQQLNSEAEFAFTCLSVLFPHNGEK